MNHASATSAPTGAGVIRHNRSTLIAQAIRLACKIVAVTTLARLVAPAEHGLFAMASSLTFLLVLFRDLGLGTAAVQTAQLDDVQRRTLWLAHVGIGALLTTVTLVLAPATAWFYHQPSVALLLTAMSPSFLLLGLGGFARAQLAREIRFGELARIDALASVVATAGMIAVGALGGGAYSFVAFLLLSEGLTAILAARACPRPRSVASFASLRPLLRTGSRITGYHVINQLTGQLDTLAVGRGFGAHVLGLYNRPFQLLALGHQYIVSPLSQISLATLSRLNDEPEAFRAHVRHAVRVAVHLSLPLATLAFVMPAEVVGLVLGPQWPEAAPLLRWLAVSAFTQTLLLIGFAVTVAAGRSERLLASAGVALPLTALAIALALPHGADGVALGLAAANLILILPRLAWMLRGAPAGLRDFLAAGSGPLAANLALAAGLLLGRHLAADVSMIARLGLAALSGAAAYAAAFALWPRLRADARELLAHLPFVGTRP